MQLTERIIEASHRLGVTSSVLEMVNRWGYKNDYGTEQWQNKYQQCLKELEDAIEHFIASKGEE